jgi:hypothetical protein
MNKLTILPGGPIREDFQLDNSLTNLAKSSDYRGMKTKGNGHYHLPA